MKCICQICCCGRHRCEHYVPKPNERGQTPCFFSTEYTDEYLGKDGQPKREAFGRPLDNVPVGGDFNGLTTNNETYKPHEVDPRQRYLPNNYNKSAMTSNDPLDTLTTHKNDYKAHEITARQQPGGRSTNRNNQKFSSDPFDGLTTNNETYKPHELASRDRGGRPSSQLRPLSGRMQDETTTGDYFKNHGTRTPRAPGKRPQSSLGKQGGQLDCETSYGTNYVRHDLTNRKGERNGGYSKWQPPTDPFANQTESSDKFRRHSALPERSMGQRKRSNLGGSDEPFDPTSTYSDNYVPKLVSCPSVSIVGSNFQGYRIIDNAGHRFLEKIPSAEPTNVSLGGDSPPLPPIGSTTPTNGHYDQESMPARDMSETSQQRVSSVSPLQMAA